MGEDFYRWVAGAGVKMDLAVILSSTRWSSCTLRQPVAADRSAIVTALRWPGSFSALYILVDPSESNRMRFEFEPFDYYLLAVAFSDAVRETARVIRRKREQNSAPAMPTGA